VNYSVPSIFTGLNNTQKSEYSYRDRWEKWREHLKNHPKPVEENIQEVEPKKVVTPPVLLQKHPAPIGFSPTHDAQATTLFCTTLLTRG
jgi:hypothetical protein